MKLITKILLILSPVLVGVGFLTWMLFYIGEFTSIEDATTQQLNNHEIVYSADGVFSPYKWHMLQRRSPKLLILGSSRVMSFRSQFFHLKEEEVYNAGMSLGNIWRVQWVLDALKAQSKLPEILIVGLDQDWFVPGRSSPKAQGKIAIFDPVPSSFDLQYILNRIRRVLGGIIENRYALVDILDRRDPFYETPAIGFNSITQSTGFRWDGSHLIDPITLNTLPDDARFLNVRQLITNNAVRFTPSHVPNKQSFDAVEQIIAFCQQNNIYLIAFTPPYAPTIYSEMQATEQYGYISKTVTYLKNTFANTDFTYFNFTDGRLSNVTNKHYLDGNHGSEFVYLNLYLEILKETEHILGDYSEIEYLEPYTLKPSERSQFEVFGVNK